VSADKRTDTWTCDIQWAPWAMRTLVAAKNCLDWHCSALSRYYLGPRTRAGFIFGYGAVDLPDMNRGLSSLRKALQK
jgi:hypothetical protein